MKPLPSFFDELESIVLEKDASFTGAVQRLGQWAKGQYNQLNLAAGQALHGYQTVNPLTSQVSPPILGTLKNFVINKLPSSPASPPSRLKSLASSKPAKILVPVVDQATEFFKLARVDPYQQKTQYSCSAACLKSVLQHWGADRFAEHEIMHAIGVHQKSGAEVDQIVEAAKKLGFDAYDKSFKSLDEAKKLTDQDIPIIADIQSFNHPGSGHYVVITKIEDAVVHLMDPNTDGNERRITRAEMERRWWDRRMKAPHELMTKWGIVITPRQ